MRSSPVLGGTQNRLFRLEMQDGHSRLLKIYHRDRWNRLEREFSVLSALGEIGLEHVPRALLKNDALSYAVYSFEPGSVRSPTQLDRNDLLAVASFVVDLQGVAPDSIERDLLSAVDCGFSIDDQLDVIGSRLRAFEEFAADTQAYEEVRELYTELDLRAHITELITAATTGVSDSDRAARLPRSEWRLNTGDFCPVNLLFTDDGRLTVVDFESAGWDDPARMVMGFVASAASEGISADGVQVFLAAYAGACDLSASDVVRFERIGMLLDLEWVAIYASALTSDVVRTKEFADPALDRHAYLESAITRLKRRLARASTGVGYQFPR
jgi:hypothetical protein